MDEIPSLQLGRCRKNLSVGRRSLSAMATANEHDDRDSLWVSTLHWLLIALGVAAPWFLHFTVAWWAAFLAMLAFMVVYNWFFVPEGSICMGIPFMLPFATSLVLLLLQSVLLLRWCAERFSGG